MSSDANVQIVQDAYAAFLRGDVPAILAILDENVEWIIPGSSPDAGTYSGPAGVLQFFQLVAQTWTFQVFNPRQYVASGDAVVALGNYTATSNATGNAVSSEFAMVWTFREGKVTAFREHMDTAALLPALQMRSTA